MKVKALKSFGGASSRGRYHYSEGQVFDLPDGADWLKAGLVVAVKEERETAVTPKTAETAVTPKTAETAVKLKPTRKRTRTVK